MNLFSSRCKQTIYIHFLKYITVNFSLYLRFEKTLRVSSYMFQLYKASRFTKVHFFYKINIYNWERRNFIYINSIKIKMTQFLAKLIGYFRVTLFGDSCKYNICTSLDRKTHFLPEIRPPFLFLYIFRRSLTTNKY